MKALAAVAAIGFGLSAAAHLLSFCAIDLGKIFPAVWLLHVGIFVVWIPAVLISRKLIAQTNRKDSWKAMSAWAPPWMGKLCGVLFAYAFFNFFFTLLVLKKSGSPGIVNGEKVLQSHGRIIQKLSEDEYRRHQAYDIRVFSGHWMV